MVQRLRSPASLIRSKSDLFPSDLALKWISLSILSITFLSFRSPATYISYKEEMYIHLHRRTSIESDTEPLYRYDGSVRLAGTITSEAHSYFMIYGVMTWRLKL